MKKRIPGRKKISMKKCSKPSCRFLPLCGGIGEYTRGLIVSARGGFHVFKRVKGVLERSKIRKGKF